MQSDQNEKRQTLDVLDILASDNYVIFNKTLAKKIGVNEAIVLGELASEARYWKSSGKMEDGWFFSTDENLAERLPFSVATIRRAVTSLEKAGILETKVFGVPPVKHYRIQFSQNDQIDLSTDLNSQIDQIDLVKLTKLNWSNCTTKNKEKNKEKNTQKGADAPANDKKENEETKQPEQYGNEQVNEFLKAWLEETGDDFSKVQRERRATWNLIKKLPPEALKPLLTAVGEARGSGDRFAPQIATPSDLVGKYSKLPKLRAWTARMQEEERQNREWIPDYNGELPAYAKEPELSDQERERVLEKMREFRQGNHKWLKSRGEEDESE